MVILLAVFRLLQKKERKKKKTDGRTLCECVWIITFLLAWGYRHQSRSSLIMALSQLAPCVSLMFAPLRRRKRKKNLLVKHKRDFSLFLFSAISYSHWTQNVKKKKKKKKKKSPSIKMYSFFGFQDVVQLGTKVNTFVSERDEII